MALCAFGETKSRVQMETGGAFGGKKEYPSMIAGHAALLAMKSGPTCENRLRPHGRHGGDDETASFKTRHRTAVSKEGKILEARSSSPIDGGAIMQTLSSWSCRAVRFHAEDLIFGRACAFARKAVATNTPPHGRFADLGRRRVCLQWSGTWTASRGRGNFSGRNSPEKFSEAGQTMTTEQTIREEIVWIVLCSAGRWNFPAMPRRKRALRKKTRTDRAKKESGSRFFAWCGIHGLRRTPI